MNKNGFTLVELMMVVAILAIISSVALPWYGQYVQRSQRTEALSTIDSFIAAQQDFHLDSRTYTTDLTELGLPNAASFTTSDGNYVVTAESCDDPTNPGNNLPLTQCIQFRATAQGSQAEDGNIVMNTLGIRQRITTDSTINF